MIILRRRYEAEQINYFREMYNQHGEIPEKDNRAILMRMQFFQHYVLNRVDN